MFEVTASAAFIAGLVSFLSPCVLPMVPFYLGYLGGLSAAQLQGGDTISPAIRRRALISALAFAAGMVTVFAGLGASASLLGQALREWFDVLRWLAGGLIAAMGLHFLGLVRIGLLNRQWQVGSGAVRRATSLASAYGIGLAFAFGWTPCVGPVLAAILVTAGAVDSTATGARLLIVYGAGMTLPFILFAAMIGPAMALLNRLRPHLGRIERTTGATLVLFGVLVASGGMGRIGFWLYEAAPIFQRMG